jgi:hypothetical protein
MAQVKIEAGSYGLCREILSPMETLAQSVFTIAPTTTPVATIPLVCALAGGGTWLAYVVYGWMGSLATYGFIVTCALVCIALPRYLRDHDAYRPGAQLIPRLVGLAMWLALAGNLIRSRRAIRKTAVHLFGLSRCRHVVVLLQSA